MPGRHSTFNSMNGNGNTFRHFRQLLWASLILCALSASAAPASILADGSRSVSTQVLPLDRSTVLPVRPPNAARLRELAAQRDFHYQDAKVELGFWERFWNWVWSWLNTVSGTRSGRLTWRYGIYTVLAVILVYAVLKLLQVDVTGIFGRKPRRAPLPYDVAGENIHDVDFPGRIAAAEAAGDFRLATRLGYLAVLKTLSDHNLISWQPDKTNLTYLYELNTSPLRDSFREATRQFEYVWYGELPLSAALYQQVRISQRAVTALLAHRRSATLAPTA